MGIYRRIKKVLAIILLAGLLVSFPRADELESSNYKITGANVGSQGDVNSSTSYSLLSSGGQALNDDRFSSSLYSIGSNFGNEIQANVPLVKCFETTTNGSTSCEAASVSGGMVSVCGYSGCYDRARFEIDTQGNPSDALYSIQIKKSSDSVWKYIDASTNLIEETSTHDLNDYLTETAWETPIMNILGLVPNTSYDIRATALKGNFTESFPSPSVSATTAFPVINFDIDIADSSSPHTEESSGPYKVELGLLSPISVTTSAQLIWLDVNTNAVGGASINVSDQNSGLKSNTSGHTITSSNSDLGLAGEGFGLVSFHSSQGSLGPIAASSNFNQGTDIVGAVSTTIAEIFTTSGKPINSGRTGLYVKTRINTSTPAGSDYSDLITFTALGTY